MKKLVCNYSIVRFLPYPETEEFVNVGILACCPQVGWMDFIVEVRKTKRISNFFPELDMQTFIAGRHHFIEELNRLVGDFRLADTQQWVMQTQKDYVAGLFAELIRPREEIFRFGEVATLLTQNPKKDLRALFNHYVDRNFAKHKDYQEKVMTDRLTTVFRERNLLNRYRAGKIGNDEYHVTLPFIARDENDSPVRALKPLNLAQEEATQIRNHGDAWEAKIKRLRKKEFMPQDMLFAVKLPKREFDKQWVAAKEICALLEQQNVLVEDFENVNTITQFAAQNSD